MIGNPSVKRSWVYYQNVLYWKLTIKWRDYFVYRVSFSCKTNFWFSDSFEYQDRISLDRQTSKLSFTYRTMVFHENTSILCMISTRFYLNNIYLSIKIASLGRVQAGSLSSKDMMKWKTAIPLPIARDRDQHIRITILVGVMLCLNPETVKIYCVCWDIIFIEKLIR